MQNTKGDISCLTLFFHCGILSKHVLKRKCNVSPFSPVLQFVPRYVDVRICNFTQRIEKGLTMAFAEVRRRRHKTEGFAVRVRMSLPCLKFQKKIDPQKIMS